jgi:biotin synthase
MPLPCIRDWTTAEIQEIYQSPLLELIHRAGVVHREHFNPAEVQLCHLISIKTGGCPEDCRYCAQSSRYQTSVDAQPMMQVEEVLNLAQEAAKQGASRICLGAAWREVRDSPQFDRVLEMIKSITAMGVEVCCCLGMLNPRQADKLAEAGLYAYNHNLDTSPEYYPTIITSRTYADRLKTLDAVENSGISVCCGGIIGMGESIEDRVRLLQVLANRKKHPESVPINLLIAIPGTPLQDQAPISVWEFIRMIATTRIVLPASMVRLSAGRLHLTLEQQALCFLAGANSIFYGEKLLTVENSDIDADQYMLELFGLKPRPPFIKPSGQIDTCTSMTS